MDGWSRNPGGSFGGLLYCGHQKGSESGGLGSRPGQDNLLGKLLYSNNVSSHPWIYMDANEFSGNLIKCWGVTLHNEHPIHGTSSCFMLRKPGWVGHLASCVQTAVRRTFCCPIASPPRSVSWWGGGGREGGDLQWTVIPSRKVSMYIRTL